MFRMPCVQSLSFIGAIAVASALSVAPEARPIEAQAQAIDPVIADFVTRVESYVALHQRLEGTLPELPKEATPQEIDRNQRSLAALIQSARTGAARGDLFTPDMTAFVRQLMVRVFSGPDGQRLRSSVMDENVAALELRVNQRYPDGIPLTTMPPAILGALPQLPEQMEYRFVAAQLILLDPHAHLIVDFIPDILPAR